MKSETPRHPDMSWFWRFVSDYGMSLVLLLLVIFFSVATIEERRPTGAEAGRQVAEAILDKHGSSARVLIAIRNTEEDRAYAAAVEETLDASGAQVLATCSGMPGEVTREIEAILARGESIDAVAANSSTRKWKVFDNFEEVGRQKCVIPEPYLWPKFLKTQNLVGVANQTAIYAIIAIGMTMVIISGGIDLSVGSLVALSAVTAALVIRAAGDGAETGVGIVILAAVLGILVCAIAGAFNGTMVTVFQVPPFIVTLGMMLMARGLSFRLADGQSISILPKSLGWLYGEKSIGIPNTILLMAGLYVIAHIMMSRMVFGRYLYAIGGNAEAARLAGVPVKQTRLAVYTICGAMAGLAGILLASKHGAGDPKYGPMFELDVIAAVVVGGTSLMGGHGKIFGTLIGAFIITVMKNGMNLKEVETFNQQIALGAVLLIAVLIDLLKRRGTGQRP